MDQKRDSQPIYNSDEIQQEIGRNEGQTIAQMSDSQVVSVQRISDGSVLVNARNVTFQGNAEKLQQLQNFAYLEPPPLLPYLANRSAQEEVLEDALELFKDNFTLHPFICVVHGNERECHDMFLERLRVVSLLNPLGYDQKRDTNQESKSTLALYRKTLYKNTISIKKRAIQRSLRPQRCFFRGY